MMGISQKALKSYTIDEREAATMKAVAYWTSSDSRILFTEKTKSGTCIFPNRLKLRGGGSVWP